jgi:multidrug resistance efflux pump
MKKTVPLCVAAGLLLAGCREEKSSGSAGGPSASASAPANVPTPSNRIDVPETVRQNLGITFAKVERRRVASTLRVPGRFELLPTARREYRATLPGFVRLLVNQYEQVPKGKPIFSMDSPEWHKLKQELHEAETGIERATAELKVAERTKTEAEQIAAAVQKRVDALAGAEVRRAEIETELTIRRAAIPRLEAEIEVKRAALNEAKHDLEINIANAASVLGLTPKYLRETQKSDGGHETQRWYAINQVGLSARDAGLVESIGVTDGSWIDANTLIATTVNTNAVRFRALGLQSDLGKLKEGLDAAVVPPQGAGGDQASSLPGKLQIGPIADPQQRTLDLILVLNQADDWVRPGVSSFMEIVTDGSAQPELAIPTAVVVRDELTQVFFRRDPRNPNKVIRMEADLGVSDGKWVVVKSGVKEGDEVVLHGVYELKLAGGGKPTGGGHFHADGTWHAEPDKNEQ